MTYLPQAIVTPLATEFDHASSSPNSTAARKSRRPTMMAMVRGRSRQSPSREPVTDG